MGSVRIPVYVPQDMAAEIESLDQPASEFFREAGEERLRELNAEVSSDD